MIFRVTKQGVLRGILERERVARNVWWCGVEQVVEEPKRGNKASKSEQWNNE